MNAIFLGVNLGIGIILKTIAISAALRLIQQWNSLFAILANPISFIINVYVQYLIIA